MAVDKTSVIKSTLSRIPKGAPILALLGGILVCPSRSFRAHLCGLLSNQLIGPGNGSASLAIATNRLHLGYISQPYRAILKGTGGKPPHTWSVSSGQLPPGLSLDSAKGQITGTPTRGGQYSVTITVKDAGNASASSSFSLTVFEQPLDKYGGLTNLQCANGRQAHFYTEKINNRWHLCTPAGNAFWLAAVSDVTQNQGTDYQGINTLGLTNDKYSSGISSIGTLNWAYQTLRRLGAWGFNTLGEYQLAALLPTHVDSQWPTSDRTNPIHLPFTFQLNPILYSAFNRDNYAPGPTKNTKGLYKRSVFTGYMRGMADVFDSNFFRWLAKNLIDPKAVVHQVITGPNKDFLIAMVGDESDNIGGGSAGVDFQCVLRDTLLKNPGKADPHWGWITFISSPTVAATSKSDTPKSRSPADVVYTDTKFHSKAELSTWLQQTVDNGPGYASFSALNAAWGSNYDTFGSDAVSHTETLGTGDGATTTFNFTLSSTPVTPLSITVQVGNRVIAGDDGQGPRLRSPTSIGNFLGNTGTTPLGTINYPRGAGSIIFTSPPASGASITATYQTNGWGTGHGLLDEDGTCPARTSSTCWVVTDFWNVTGGSGTATMRADLDNFLFHFYKHYFGTMKATLNAAAPGVLYLPTLIGGYGTPPRRQVLQAEGLYADVVMVPTVPSIDPNNVVTDQQARIDFFAQYLGDKPWTSFNGFWANADSYMSPYPNTQSVFNTQAQRGQYYATQMNRFLSAQISSGCNCGFSGTYPLTGMLWWQYYDSWGEKANWGLVTPRDDPYDGVSATTTPGADSWGYPTGCLPTFGCEQANYGDFIDAVRDANLNALRTLAGERR